MNKPFDKNQLLTSAVCSVVFALVVIACGGARVIISTGPGLSSGVTRVFGTGPAGNRLLPGGSNILSTASFWQTGAGGVAQSMNAACDLGFDTSAANGQFIPVIARGSSTCNGFGLAPQSGIASAFTNRVIDGGTLSAMTVIFGNPVNGSRVSLFDNNGNSLGVTCSASGSDRCDVRNAAVPLADNQRIVAYLIPAAGDTISRVEVYISKT